MKKKIIAAVLVVALLTAGAVLLFLNKDRSIADRYEKNDLELFGELNIISDAKKINSREYSLTSIKEAYRSGVRTVTLNLCFNSKGEPVISDSFKSVTDKSLKLSSVIELISQQEYSDMRCNLRLRQTGDFKAVNDIISENNIYSRIMISGLDKNRYDLLTGSDTPAQVYYDYVPSQDIQQSVEQIRSLVDTYGIGGVFIDASDISRELYQKLNLQGIACIVGNASSKKQIYDALSSGAYLIETDDPAQLKSIYESWYNKTYKRLESELYNKEKSQ